MAENNNRKFRGSLFGGFNRKDVAAYISKLAREANEFKEECSKLKTENSELKIKIEELTRQVSELGAQNEELNGELERLKAQCEENGRLKETIASMQARIDSDAEIISGYDRMKRKLSELEVEALKRAQEIEARAMSEYERIMNRVGEIIASLKNEYEEIRAGTEVTAAHLRGEINRMGERISLVNTVLEKTADDLESLDCLIKKDKDSAE
ncbi:MAG TPA: hypothetical protein GXZ65_03095 [Clostridiales bacterium]|jgi:chromosome segregation ATPase|nr:hypothetical protein [Clostridiales bacterium]